MLLFWLPCRFTWWGRCFKIGVHLFIFVKYHIYTKKYEIAQILYIAQPSTNFSRNEGDIYTIFREYNNVGKFGF